MTSKLIIFIVAALVIIGYVQCSNKKANHRRTSKDNLDTPQEKDDLKDHLVNSNVEAENEGALNRHKRYLNKKHEEVVVVVKEKPGYGGYGEHGGHGGYEEHYGKHEEHYGKHEEHYGGHEGYGEHYGGHGGHGYGHGHGHGSYGGYGG